jgi:hypothetical protein
MLRIVIGPRWGRSATLRDSPWSDLARSKDRNVGFTTIDGRVPCKIEKGLPGLRPANTALNGALDFLIYRAGTLAWEHATDTSTYRWDEGEQLSDVVL